MRSSFRLIPSCVTAYSQGSASVQVFTITQTEILEIKKNRNCFANWYSLIVLRNYKLLNFWSFDLLSPYPEYYWTKHRMTNYFIILQVKKQNKLKYVYLVLGEILKKFTFLKNPYNFKFCSKLLMINFCLNSFQLFQRIDNFLSSTDNLISNEINSNRSSVKIKSSDNQQVPSLNKWLSLII
jgi:hypothetical protein